MFFGYESIPYFCSEGGISSSNVDYEGYSMYKDLLKKKTQCIKKVLLERENMMLNFFIQLRYSKLIQ